MEERERERGEGRRPEAILGMFHVVNPLTPQPLNLIYIKRLGMRQYHKTVSFFFKNNVIEVQMSI